MYKQRHTRARLGKRGRCYRPIVPSESIVSSQKVKIPSERTAIKPQRHLGCIQARKKQHKDPCTKSIWHTDKCYPKSRQLFGHLQVGVKDLYRHRMVQRTRYGAGRVSNLFLHATESWLAVKLHKESLLRGGKPLTTDFQFLKNAKTQQLLRLRPFLHWRGHVSLWGQWRLPKTRGGVNLLTACSQTQPASSCNFTPKHTTTLLLTTSNGYSRQAPSHSPEITPLQHSQLCDAGEGRCIRLTVQHSEACLSLTGRMISSVPSLSLASRFRCGECYW